MSFNAILIEKTESGQSVGVQQLDESQLPEGDVTIDVEYSTMNYKDGLAITGDGPVVRRWPMVPGIDLVGTVSESSNPNFKAGDKVLLNGWGVGEVHWGGFAQKARLKGDWLVKAPAAFTGAQAMGIGTAGYTASLSVEALINFGVKPEDGEVLVTGTPGGVGSVAVALLKKEGFTVVASYGDESEQDYLKSLGADSFIQRGELSEPGKPFQKERWGAVVDSVGSHTLANAIAQTKYRGTVTACGLAQGSDLATSVMPFILRGVRLIGVDSVYFPGERRPAVWSRLAGDLDPAQLAAMTTTIGLSEVPEVAPEFLKGAVRGRIVVDTRR